MSAKVTIPVNHDTSAPTAPKNLLRERLLELAEADLQMIQGQGAGQEFASSFDNGFKNGFDNAFKNRA